MSEPSPSHIESRRPEIFHLISVSGTLSGLCITVVAFMNARSKAQATATIADDMLAVCSAVFLLCIYLSFAALRTKKSKLATILIRMADALFLVALTTMVVAAFVLLYTIF